MSLSRSSSIRALFALGGLSLATLLAACGGKGGGLAPQAPLQMGMPKSVSPALIKAAPMARTRLLPANAMKSPLKTMGDVQGMNWSALPGAASQVAASPDGTLWALSTQPGGPDKYIWHYAGGTWSNIGGLADHLAVAPNTTLYALNSGGGTYAYNGVAWSALGGGASGITAAADGSIYVLSNGGSGDQAIWHNVGGTWTQVPGAGVMLASSWDPHGYVVPGGTMAPSGLFILNSAGSIYYENSSGSFVTFPGAASAIAPTQSGGAFVLGYPSNSGGNTIYYYNLATPGWSQLSGAGVGISTDGATLYVIGASGAIYSSLVKAAVPPLGPAVAPSPALGPPGGWGPYPVANAFQFPVQSGYDGTGETVGIVIDKIPSSVDMTAYLSYFGVTRTGTITHVDINGGSTGTPSGEETLDAQTIAALAPGANIIVYDMPALDSISIADAYARIVSDGIASVVNMSFGGCEPPSIASSNNAIFAQGAYQGIAFVASAGDQGNECYTGGSPLYQPGVSYPASDPAVIGVGGTETQSGSAINNPVAWNDLFFGSQGSTGGGVSAIATMPPYQVGLAGVASSTNRNVPDIAMPAVNTAIYLNGGWSDYGGTSWSAPETAAMIAEINEYCTAAFANPYLLFYDAFAISPANFIDVTSGNNQFGGTTPFYSAGVGYDNVSGFGLPLGLPISQSLCKNHIPVVLKAAVRGRLALTTLAPARATLLPGVPNTRGLQDRGARSAAAPTRIVLMLRATPTLASDENTVINQLTAAGFSIVGTYSNHLAIDAQAPASVVASFFQTQMHDLVQGMHGTRYANVAPLVLPASIAPYVQGAIANNLIIATRQ